MQKYRLTVLILWVAGSIAAFLYSQEKGFPLEVALPVGLAMLVELSLYSALAFGDLRQRIGALGKRLALWLVLSAVVPYLIHAVAPGAFRWSALATLLLLSATASLWYVILPHRRITDVAFLMMMAGAYMAKLFDNIYPKPVDGLHIEVLGQLMWIRIGVSAVLLLRRMDGIGFGFWPTAKEWRIGLRQFVFFMPAGVLLMYGLEFARFDPSDGFWWKAIGIFFGILWVVALSEEFFFRGMLQRWLIDWLGTKPGLILTALLFGAVHLPFREFPNWEFAALAALAALFYGRAFIQGNGIRAGMVTHALVVATWRTFFR